MAIKKIITTQHIAPVRLNRTINFTKPIYHVMFYQNYIADGSKYVMLDVAIFVDGVDRHQRSIELEVSGIALALLNHAFGYTTLLEQEITFCALSLLANALCILYHNSCVLKGIIPI